MPSEAVQPLRINKTTQPTSPTKMAGSTFQRPLSEIGPMERRRNSPSFNQATRKMIVTRDSSPFDSSSPFTNSPRLFWQTRDPASPVRYSSENSFEREHSPSPKRNSIENLKKASRVRNSAMFALEHKQDYDPAAVPRFERPLASGRSLATKLKGNVFVARESEELHKEEKDWKGHRRGDSTSKLPVFSPNKAENAAESIFPEATASSKLDLSPSKSKPSPTKSSLATNGRWSTSNLMETLEHDLADKDGVQAPARPLRRHAKSVTFDAAPPQINEYEMVTPDPSSIASGSREGSYDSMEEYDEEESFGHGSGMDIDDSFDASLEDTEKTPVVLPEDWRHMSPDIANTSLAETFEDPFNGGQPSPKPKPKPQGSRPLHRRSDSSTSDLESRPLPPLPSALQSADSKERRDSNLGFSLAAKRITAFQRSLPSPPRPAGVSKSEILSIRDPSMTLEDRLKLMDINQKSPEQANELKQEGGEKDNKSEGLGIHIHEDAPEDDLPPIDDMEIPRISRESILRKVKSRNFDDVQFDFGPMQSNDDPGYDIDNLDPDVPIPSREVSSNFEVDVPELQDVEIKEEEDTDGEVDVYSIPELYGAQPLPSVDDDAGAQQEVQDDAEDDDNEFEREGSVIRHEIRHGSHELDVDDDDESHYSQSVTADDQDQQEQSSSTTEDDGPPTPKPEDFSPPKPENADLALQSKHMSLPEFGSFLSDDDFQSQLKDYMSPTEEQSTEPTEIPTSLEELRDLLKRPLHGDADEAERPETPGSDPASEDEPGTPDSVIRHPIQPEHRDSIEIPERKATIKAPNSNLKTRPSLTPADAATMAATRRHVSGEHPPPIPQKSPSRPSLSAEIELRPDSFTDENVEGEETGVGRMTEPLRRRSMKMKLEIPVSGLADELDFDLDKEFDRVIEAQKKGYLMRQNTKVVVASSRQFSDENPPSEGLARGTKSAGSSPTKAAYKGSATWIAEPWNGKIRRKSIRSTSGNAKRPPAGPVPPLPGQESNVATNASLGDEDPDEVTERGRLFVKVVGVKDLDLPLPKNERTWFQLTLDNGLHCVTTSWLELGRSAPIGQEFELVVLQDLEFQLTLQTKLEPPPKPQQPVIPVSSPTKVVHHKKSSSAFGRLWGSPKKKKQLLEQERRLQEEAERAAAAARHQQELLAKQEAAREPTAWDMLHNLVASDGSFARAYVCLKTYEKQAFGRPFTVDVPCFNEWAVDDEAVASSVKSKHGGIARRPPYRVGKLTLQLLYVPKPKGAKDEDMPKSMNACVRELKEAEELKKRVWEGHLSQQGGDCPYWRRRFFRLAGTKLTAYHEITRQPRATINLAKAAKLIDDRTALTQPTGRHGRRKSAFAEEEEGYMFVEEGFRIRFANGEIIDFYADSAAEKEGWMKVLSDVIGKDAASCKGWAEIVLAREKAEKERPVVPQLATAQAALREHARAAGSKSEPNSPVKRHGGDGLPPPPVEKSPRHRNNIKPQRRAQVQSMVF